MSTYADAVKLVEELGCRRAQDYPEAEKLFATLPRFERYLEIGCRHGWTFGIVAELIEPSVMVGVDMPGVFPWGDEGSQAVFETIIKRARDNGTDAHAIFGDSREPDNILRASEFAPFDVLFIDGDHRYEGVKADWLNYSPLVKQGGCVIFHDIYPPKKPKEKQIEVDILWRELKTQFESWEIHEGGSGLGLLRYES